MLHFLCFILKSCQMVSRPFVLPMHVTPHLSHLMNPSFQRADNACPNPPLFFCFAHRPWFLSLHCHLRQRQPSFYLLILRPQKTNCHPQHLLHCRVTHLPWPLSLHLPVYLCPPTTFYFPPNPRGHRRLPPWKNLQNQTVPLPSSHLLLPLVAKQLKLNWRLLFSFVTLLPWISHMMNLSTATRRPNLLLLIFYIYRRERGACGSLPPPPPPPPAPKFTIVLPNNAAPPKPLPPPGGLPPPGPGGLAGAAASLVAAQAQAQAQADFRAGPRLSAASWVGAQGKARRAPESGILPGMWPSKSHIATEIFFQ